MNQYQFEDLRIGMEGCFSKNITEDMAEKFLEITGDMNPLHTDDGFAQRRGYPRRVVHGMLTASLYSTLAGLYLPGEQCLLWEVDAKFASPVYIGDRLEVYGKITEVNGNYHYIRVKSHIKNQNGKTVSRAVITAGVHDV